MRATGYVRKVDELGRVVLPKELRKSCNLHAQDQYEIFIDGQSILIERYYPRCVFCGNIEPIKEYKGKKICGRCLNELEK